MPTELKTLKVTLAEWTEVDAAVCAVTELLGLIDFEVSPFQTKSKHVFWSAHPVGEMACYLLEKLVSLDILERREDPDKDIEYRWNPSYRGSWE